MKSKHTPRRPSDAAIAKRWSERRAEQRNLITNLRRAGVVYMVDGDIEVRSVPCPCDARHRALVAIDSAGRWVADCGAHLGITAALSRTYGA